VRVLTDLETNGGLLWTRWWTFHKIGRISWSSEQL